MLAETLTMWELNDDRAGKHPKGRDHWTDYVEQQAPADGEMMPARLEGGSEAEAVPATDRSCRLELTIPVAAAGMVVGKQGKTIKNIKLRSGASVWLAPEPLASDPSRKAITLTGSAAQVAAARESVLEVMFGWLRNAPDEEGGGRDATEAHARSLVTKVEIFVTVAAAAMIIGKKGLMLKLLQTKSKAKIQLDQDAMTDGRKRVVLEGTMEAVHNAQKQVSDIVAACDDSKYEEQAKRRSETEEGKKTAFDTEKKKAATAKATQEEKRKLAAKVAANPFMFLKGSDDEESEEEEEEEEEEVAVKEAAPSGKSKRKKKGRPGLAPAPEPEAPENPRAGVRAAAPGGGGVRSASVVSEESQEEEDASEEDGERKIGLDRLLHTMHAELDPVETARKFGKEETVASQEPALLRLDVGSLSRRGVSHANEDRLAILEFTDLLSEGALAALLLDSRSRSMPFFAVFDGHGGGAVSEMASKQLAGNVASALEEILTAEGQVGKAATEQLPRAFEKGFQDTEEQAVAMHATGDRSGACALAMVMCENGGEYMLHVANLGDCRAIVARRDTNVHPAKIVPVHLTADHRATVQTERSRIEAAGGEVKDKRALGDLIPSRTLGDIKTKNKCPGAVSAAPEMTTHILTEEDSTIIVASDGLWDDMKVPKVMELLLKHPTPDTAAHAIATAVIKKYGAKNTKPNDDLTIIAVNLQWP
ncbi:phosphatase 2C-like domain-containing protein [Baffinella frigidus]|nr:phosphatase 2C-like domain-containing protein [Cryptophyta sp. CCMP2293]